MAGIVYKQVLINKKLQIGKRGQKMSGRSPLRRRRFALDCSANEEEEEKKYMGLPQ